MANVTPIQKKADKTPLINYKPINLAFVDGKLMESIMRNKLLSILEDNIFTNNIQHGFSNKRSCRSNLLDFYNDVFNIYDEIKAVDIIYLDFQKTIDMVPH